VFGDHTRAFKYVDFPFAMGADGVKVLRARDGFEPKYLYRYLQSRKIPSAGYSRHYKFLKEIHVPRPSLDEQRRIAEILDHADALRAKRRQVLAHLDALTQSIFHDMFGRNEWPSQELSNAVRDGTIVTYGIVQAGPECDDGVPYIRTGDIVDGEINVSALRRTDPAIAARFERSRVCTGEIVMSIRATVGTTAIVPPSIDGANLTQGTARIAPGRRTVAAYLLSFLRSRPAQRWVQAQVKGATFREITLGRLREMQVSLPPLGLQKKFAARTEEVNTQRALVQRALSADDELFASLQSRAFRGEL
jgi:type I restriction enzyme S subunit